MYIKKKKTMISFCYLHLPYTFHNTENKNRVGYTLQKKFLRWEKISEGLRLNEGSWWVSGKESTCQCRRHWLDPQVRKIPWRRKGQPTPVFLLGKFHGQRILADYSPWDCKRVRHDLVTKQQQED